MEDPNLFYAAELGARMESAVKMPITLKSCSNCTYYYKGFCRVFSDKYEGKVAAVTARVSENMCSQTGKYYEAV
jgi:hypothetical protein